MSCVWRICFFLSVCASICLAECPYEVLGLAKGASVSEIKKSYRKAALRWHPDKASEEDKDIAEAQFIRVSRAYEFLKTEKDHYDQGRVRFDEEATSSIQIKDVRDALKLFEDMFSQLKEDLRQAPIIGDHVDVLWSFAGSMTPFRHIDEAVVLQANQVMKGSVAKYQTQIFSINVGAEELRRGIIIDSSGSQTFSFCLLTPKELAQDNVFGQHFKSSEWDCDPKSNSNVNKERCRFKYGTLPSHSAVDWFSNWLTGVNGKQNNEHHYNNPKALKSVARLVLMQNGESIYSDPYVSTLQGIDEYVQSQIGKAKQPVFGERFESLQRGTYYVGIQGSDDVDTRFQLSYRLGKHGLASELYQRQLRFQEQYSATIKSWQQYLTEHSLQLDDFINQDFVNNYNNNYNDEHTHNEL